MAPLVRGPAIPLLLLADEHGPQRCEARGWIGEQLEQPLTVFRRERDHGVLLGECALEPHCEGVGAEHVGEQPDVLPEHGLASNHDVGDQTPLDSTMRATTICGREPTAEEISSYSFPGSERFPAPGEAASSGSRLRPDGPASRPQKGGQGRASYLRSTGQQSSEEDATMAIVDEYAVGGPRLRETSACEHCGHVAQWESDPSMMLGLVMLVAANAFVVLAVAAAIVWLVV